MQQLKTIEILKPQSQIPLEKSVIKEKRMGRPQTLSTEDLLHAIKLYLTTSETELSGRLNISRQTIYRKMKLIPKETIVQIFQDLSESDLKPYQMTYEGFLTIPEVEQFKKALERRQVSRRYKNDRLRWLWHLCVYLKKHPRKLSIDECADFLIALKERKISKLNHYHVKKVMRSFFQNVYGINGDVLTSKGIDASLDYELGKRAHDRLTPKQRYAFIKALKEIVEKDSLLNAWISLPYFLYHTATRIEASLKARIEDIEKQEDYWIITVIDKGKHKNGRKIWRKLIIGELKEQLEKNLASRGNIESGFLFPFYHDKVRLLFIKAYERAGISIPKQPCHIWRHTSAQEFLEATDWNYELCAQTLGWEDPRILRKCYGSMSEKAKEKALRKAMGMPIQETKREFKF
jgi:integrase